MRGHGSAGGAWRRGSAARAIAWLVLFAAAGCASDTSPDGGLGDAGEDVGVHDADLPDATADAGRDGGFRDARVDAGPPDAGACGCSYGFHHECPNGQICQTGRFDTSVRGMCVRADPRGGAINGQCSAGLYDDPLFGSCTAQCEVYQHGTPCGDWEPGVVADAIGKWVRAVDNASMNYPDLQSPQRMSAEDLAMARGNGSFGECGDLVGWTVLGLIELCRGDEALIPPPSGSFNVLDAWRFKPIPMDDDCRLFAGDMCAGGLGHALDINQIDYIDLAVTDVFSHCPNGVPYSNVCSGPDAQACVIARIRTIYQALRTRH